MPGRFLRGRKRDSGISYDFYVSQTGGGDGSSPSSTLSMAWFNTSSNWANPKQAGKIGPGDTVALVGTITSPLTFQASGSSGNPITVIADGAAAITTTTFPPVAINGKSYVTLSGVPVTYTGTEDSPRVIYNSNGSNVDYVIIDGCTVTLSGDSTGIGVGIWLGSSRYSRITNNTVAITAETGTNGGVVCFYSNDLTISGNEIYGNASETIGTVTDALVVSGRDIVIENNIVHDGWSYDNHPDGIVVQGDGDRNSQYTANVSILRNTVYNFSQGIMFDAYHNPIDGTNLVANNVVYETSSYRYGGANKMNGLVFDGGTSGANHWINVNAYNNTIDSKQVRLYVLRQSSGSAINIKNNVYLTPAYTTIYISVTTGVTMDYNYYSGADSTPIHWGGTAYSIAGLRSAASQELNAVSGTAGLNANYTVAVGSDVRSRGTNLSTSFTTDRAGTTRPSAPTAWDSGAYQYV